MPRIGPMELVIILLILMLIFGAGRLPQIGSSLGRSLRAFKGAVTGQDDGEGGEDEESKKAGASSRGKNGS